MSYKENIVVSNGPVQLVDRSKFGASQSKSGVTCTNNGDGSWTINGEVTAENRFNVNFYNLGANAIPYWLSANVPVEHNYYVQDCFYDKLGGWLYYYLEVKTYDNFTIYPQIFDLTATFGSGNEPTNKEQVKAKFPGDLYPYSPSNKVSTYKEMIKISDVCQLIDTKGKSTTEKGIVCTNNGDGTWTLNGVNETGANSYLNFANVGKNRFAGSIYLTAPMYYNGYVVDCNYDTNNGQVFYTLEAGKVYDNLVLKPQLFDLTEMYGAGNEPTSVTEFKEKFPEAYYSYSPKCFISNYKTITKVGNVTQLIKKSYIKPTHTTSSVTFTNNGDGSITLSGTNTQNVYTDCIKAYIDVVKGHTYLMFSFPNGNPAGKNVSCPLWDSVNKKKIATDYGSGAIAKVNLDNTIYGLHVLGNGGVVTDGIVIRPQLFDLTEMYGAGNEPKTVAEFKADFPEIYYNYAQCNV